MNLSIYPFLVIFILLLPNKSFCQATEIIQKISDKLVDEGFQNIGVATDNNTLIVQYENRRYRLEALALKQVIGLVGTELPTEIDTLIVITQQLNIPILTTTIPVASYQKSRQDTTSNNAIDFAKTIKVQQKLPKSYATQTFANQNRGNYKFELEIEPELRLGLGGFPDPVVHQFNLLPTAHFYLWKGARASFQTTLPIFNEFDIPEETFFRPRILQLEQRLRLPAQTYLYLTAGYFTENRYGGQAELGKYFWNGRLLLRAKAGYTGYATYVNEPEIAWQITRPSYLDYQFGADYYFKKWNVIASAEYAKTLSDQHILRLSTMKYFNEVNIGFFVFRSERGNNFGFQCAIPLAPKKYFKPGFLSVRPSKHFRYTYYGTQKYVRQYFTKNALRNSMRRLEPFFIQRQLAFGL
ncbi:MAG: YjbH domain-containing protein [Saprospiraceae bacterium]